jgi:hypothetical protein
MPDKLICDIISGLLVDLTDAKGILCSALATLRSVLKSEAARENVSPIIKVYYESRIDIVQDNIERIINSLNREEQQ